MLKNKFGWIGFGLTSLILMSFYIAVNIRDNNKHGETMVVTGAFELQLSPQTEDEINVGRMLISKTYRGGLDGSGQGQMLSKRTEIEGSAGYVAIEVFNGSIQEKHGSFILLHTGIMNRGTSSLEVNVVPDSGTGELEGISGTMQINQSEGKHSYEFEYTLNEEK